MIYVGIDVASDKHDFMLMTDKGMFTFTPVFYFIYFWFLLWGLSGIVILIKPFSKAGFK